MNNELICNKFINQYLLRGKKFVEYACFRYGYYNAQISGKIGNGFVDDFQYFVFTKSIKSLWFCVSGVNFKLLFLDESYKIGI